MDGEIVLFVGRPLSKNEASSQQVVEVRVRFLGSNRESEGSPPLKLSETDVITGQNY